MARRRSFDPRQVPATFWADREVQEALARRDIRSFLGLYSQRTAASQTDIAACIGRTQPEVWRMMRTARQVLTIDVLVDIADGLAMPDRARLLLGLAPTALLVATVGGDEPVGWTSGPAAAGGRPGEEDWLERRDFMAAVAATAFGPGGGALLPGSASGFPDVSSSLPSRVGLHDVQRIEATTRAFRDWDHLYGGGLSRAAVVAQFRHVLGMHEASVTPAVRVALHHATAELGSLAAWMTYDVEEHRAARQLWMLALRAAREADDADLLAEVLTRMAHQALHLGRADEALGLLRIARTAAEDGRSAPSPSTRCKLAAMQAWSHAAAGRVQPCLRAVGEAESVFADVDPASAPQWLRYFDAAEFAGLTGHCYHVLAVHDPGRGQQAAERLQAAVDGYDPGHQRTIALNLTGLATTHFRNGDIDAAVRAGHDALDLVTQLTSTRAYARVRTLQQAAVQWGGEPSAAALTDRLRTVLADA